MTESNVAHGVFTVERTYDHPPAHVYAAFATEEGKVKWFSGPNDECTMVARSFDFRVGGREQAKGRWKSGMVSDFQAQYWDIIPNERIVYTYEMHLDDRKISVSLATIEFRPVGEGTRLVITEQGAFLDGYDDAGSRQHGANFLVDKMGASL